MKKGVSKGLAWLNSIKDIVTDDCQLYPFSKSTGGYGLVGGFGKGKFKYAHRVMFDMVNNSLPEAVLHSCDTPACCNPKHLITGTFDSNNKDRAAKGRSAKVVNSRRALDAIKCAAIRKRYDPTRVGIKAPNGITQLALDYKVDKKIIAMVLDGSYKEAI